MLRDTSADFSWSTKRQMTAWWRRAEVILGPQWNRQHLK